ncbi:MAG: UvrB/UvrC motif-containing protein [Patescibacteria group bacterium]
MIWGNFLHIYQPANQIKEIFDKVVSECYLPLFKSLVDNPKSKITLNINAALTERLVDYPEVLDNLKKAASNRQIEFTDSAKYHTLLPFLPEDEIERQITLNRETNKKILGDCYSPIGFFPPEMAYSPKILPILEKLGYEWLIMDEIGRIGQVGQIGPIGKTYKIKGSKMNVFFRERGPSNLIMSAMVRCEEDLKYYLKDEYGKKGYMVTGMDGETFGHHRPGLQSLLTELLVSKEFDHAFFSELLQLFPETETVTPVVSTWASSQKDIEEGIQFISWDEPDNQIQRFQWELQRLVLEKVKDDTGEARKKLDMGLASDQFFWASAKPWWSLEVIELGAWTLLDALKSLPDPDQKIIERAYDLYLKIIAMAFEWQRTGKVREISKQMKDVPRIPFKDKTKTEPWVYNAFIDLLKQSMKEAAKKENFEEAILWRDAIWKIETKNDVFDAVHAIDLLRIQIPGTEILNIIDKHRKEYERLVSGQPEQRAI